MVEPHPTLAQLAEVSKSYFQRHAKHAELQTSTTTASATTAATAPAPDYFLLSLTNKIISEVTDVLKKALGHYLAHKNWRNKKKKAVAILASVTQDRANAVFYQHRVANYSNEDDESGGDSGTEQDTETMHSSSSSSSDNDDECEDLFPTFPLHICFQRQIHLRRQKLLLLCCRPPNHGTIFKSSILTF